MNSRLFSISIRTRVSFNSNRKHHACQINVGSVSVKSRKELLRSFHRIVWIERKCFAVFEIVRHRASKAKSGVHNEERKPRAGNDCKGRAVLEAWPEKAENAEALPTYCLQLYLARRTLVWGTFTPRHYLRQSIDYVLHHCLSLVHFDLVSVFGFYFILIGFLCGLDRAYRWISWLSLRIKIRKNKIK